MAYGLERGDPAGLGRDVVDEDTAVRLGAEPVVELETTTPSAMSNPRVEDESCRGYNIRGGALRYPLVAAVASLEVQVRGPVVGEVVGESAGGAGGVLRDVVGGHGHVEGVAADNLVDMGRRDLARVDEGVYPVNDDLGAAEPQHGHLAEAAESTAELGVRRGCSLGERRKGEERSPQHRGSSYQLLETGADNR